MRIDEAMSALLGIDGKAAQSMAQFEEAMRAVQPAMELYQRVAAAIRGPVRIRITPDTASTAGAILYPDDNDTSRRIADIVQRIRQHGLHIRPPRRDARRAHRRAMKRGRR